MARDAERAHRLRSAAREIARDLRGRREVEAVWLIGSLVWGGFGTRSDVDVVVRGAGAPHHGRLWAHWVERLGADAGERVDLLRLEELPEAFQRRVLTEGLRLDEP